MVPDRRRDRVGWICPASFTGRRRTDQSSSCRSV